jgi:hypothetical protein
MTEVVPKRNDDDCSERVKPKALAIASMKFIRWLLMHVFGVMINWSYEGIFHGQLSYDTII